MPIVNGRLTCCSCGADLGDAEDQYRDPDCYECLKRDEAEEAAREEADREKGDDDGVEYGDPRDARDERLEDD